MWVQKLEKERQSDWSPVKNEPDDLFGTIGSRVDRAWRNRRPIAFYGASFGAFPYRDHTIRTRKHPFTGLSSLIKLLRYGLSFEITFSVLRNELA